MTKHTPGPWERMRVLGHNESQTWEQFVGQGRGAMIVAHDGSDEGNANASLAASAPELLAALDAKCAINADLLAALKLAEATIDRLAVPGTPRGQSAQGTRDVIAAAISRAEGQS